MMYILGAHNLSLDLNYFCESHITCYILIKGSKEYIRGMIIANNLKKFNTPLLTLYLNCNW